MVNQCCAYKSHNRLDLSQNVASKKWIQLSFYLEYVNKNCSSEMMFCSLTFLIILNAKINFET